MKALLASVALLAIPLTGCPAHAVGVTPRLGGAKPLPVPEGPRVTAVISDLHIGPGRAGGAWHHYEDFRWADDLAAFLTSLDVDGGGQTDLVLLGDTFELWQGADHACASEDDDVGCSEEETLDRLNRAIHDHAEEIAALGAFARSGNNRVWVVPGNHDAALLFPKAAARLLAALAAPGRCDFRPEGYWLSQDGRIYAEHGHQLADDPNQYDDWPSPFVRGGKNLRRSWGEQFVREFYDVYEDRYPVIDNVNSKRKGIEYGLAREKVPGFGAALGRLLRFVLTESSFAQTITIAGDSAGGPAWNLKAIRAKGGEFLIESLSKDDPLRIAAAAAVSADPNDAAKTEAARQVRAQLDQQAAKLTDTQIGEICAAREDLATKAEAARKKAGAPADPAASPVTRCPRPASAGVIVSSVTSSKRERFQKRLDAALADVKRDDPSRSAFKVFVWGHTHVPERAESYKAGKGWAAMVTNSGAWQRAVSPAWFDAEVARRGLARSEAIHAIQLDDLPPCYAFVRIPPGSVKPELRFWTRIASGAGTVREKCVSTCLEADKCTE